MAEEQEIDYENIRTLLDTAGDSLILILDYKGLIFPKGISESASKAINDAAGRIKEAQLDDSESAYFYSYPEFAPESGRIRRTSKKQILKNLGLVGPQLEFKTRSIKSMSTRLGERFSFDRLKRLLQVTRIPLESLAKAFHSLEFVGEIFDLLEKWVDERKDDAEIG